MENVLKEFLNAYNRHDVDGIMAFFSEDCVFEAPRGPEVCGKRWEGKEQIRKAVASRFEGLPDAHYGQDRHFFAGDRAASEWTLTGTLHNGDKLKVRGCDLFELRNGKIVKKDSFWKIVEG